VSDKSTTYLLLVATTVVWGGSFVAVKSALQYLSPVQLLIMRFVPAAIAFSALLWGRERDALSGLLRNHWRSLSWMGLFGVIGYHWALNTGEQLIPAGTASVLMALNPAFIAILSLLFLGEPITRARALGLTVAFVGLIVIVGFSPGAEISLRLLQGVLITLIAPISWAFYTVVSRPLAARHSPVAVTGLGTIIGTLPIALAARPALLVRLRVMPPTGWASVAFLAFGATLFGVTTWVRALERMEASRVGAFIYLVPLWAVVLSRLLLAEPITVPLVVGACAIVSGVALISS
jgi:drug/metabolite transporter (DMT)-like permease